MSNEQARAFHALHQNGLLILPNAWDAASARVIEVAGAKAIATSSAAVAWAHGYPDGEAQSQEMLLETVRAIARVVKVPVSADIEAGYDSDPERAGDFTARVIDAGAVGINIEDGKSSPDLLCAKIERARKAASRAGVDLWINARVDVYLLKLAEGAAAYDETVSRALRYAAAGANSIFAPGLAEDASIARLVTDVPLPINLLAWPNLPDAKRLIELGVRRLSAGTGIAKLSLLRTQDLAGAFLETGDSQLFDAGWKSPLNMNGLMKA
jgi:2-methylisocitrate lyase-like PEP mutase family enzyme